MEIWIMSAFLLTFTAILASVDHFLTTSFSTEEGYSSKSVSQANVDDFSYGFLLFFAIITIVIIGNIK